MVVREVTRAAAAALAEAELVQLYNDTGIDLTMLPAVMTAEELARALNISVGSLSQDRYRNRGIPYIRIGRRIRYARADAARHLAANRSISPRGAA